MFLSLIGGLILGAASVVFALQNVFPVTVTFLSWEVTTSLAVIIMLAIFVGFVVSSLLSIPSVIKNIFIVSKLKKDNKNLTEDLQKIHTIHQDSLASKPVEDTSVLG